MIGLPTTTIGLTSRFMRRTAGWLQETLCPEAAYGVRLGLGDTPPGVPEPATWAMMLVGFAGLGVALRSRRMRAAAIG